jgi:16S rRNA (cytosine967-C5)-methyltransferase
MVFVFADAPWSGSGVWRCRPDAIWRLTPVALVERIKEQRQVLAAAAPLVKPGGRLVYATCSVLPSENEQQTEWFLENHSGFARQPWTQLWQMAAEGAPAPVQTFPGAALQLTPARHGTDGFYVSILSRSA